MTRLFYDPLFLEHQTGRHVEQPARYQVVAERLGQTGLLEACTTGHYRPLDAESLARLHSPSQIARVEQQAQGGGGHLDPDTVVSPASYRVGCAAAGACVAAVDAVLNGPDTQAFCLVRPPGHHATPERSMGFCLFNSIGLAAEHALRIHGLERILIVDWDVHHGNGTQDCFYTDPRVHFLSIHRYGHLFYPGTGAADEIGEGAGRGFTCNVPMAYGTSREVYRQEFERALYAAAEQIQPQLVFVSAGFDAHIRDPIGSLGLETEDFVTLTQQVQDVARSHAKGRLVSCLEGGYHLEALADSVQAHLETLLSVAKP